MADLEQLLGELIVESSQLLATSQSDQAVLILQPHFQKFEKNPIYLQTLGEALLENSDVQSAYEILSKACEIDNDASKGVEKFLYLGQIIGGEDGVKLLNVGVEKLLKQLDIIDNNNNNNSKNIENIEMDQSLELLINAYGTLHKTRNYLINKLNQALFAIIEIWMTDLCMQEDAEQRCEETIQLALKLDPENGETWSMLSSIRISQQRTDEAKQSVLKSWEMFYSKKSKLEELANESGNIQQQQQEEEEEEEEDINEAQLQYTELCQPLLTLAKYAIELGLFEIAINISSSVQDINEQSVESFYLEGFANYLNAKRIQNSIDEDKGYEISNDFENYKLNYKIDKNDNSWNFINDSRIAFSNAYKLLQVDSISDEIDSELRDTIPMLLEQVGGLLLKVKDDGNINESNWENEIQMDDD
ncbi:hypothetical protein CANARDRAFT_204522 [[Candida] arabinofermentans NRRL YB-2248]|uniref:Uncharacterized protein n=1 Tax=[Candida] arabinofermentans NRRL YB-2248 TaxID=983967 RepID=A0A1E4STD7_9ASCO|nr:hypothetical protein CANARDRAFT_204522 [[Candida] arabinofermentans NRRL YB-2248]